MAIYFTVCIILLHVKTELKLHTIMFTCFHGWMYMYINYNVCIPLQLIQFLDSNYTTHKINSTLTKTLSIHLISDVYLL